MEGVASVIEEVVRSSDFAARYGGEEFIITLMDVGENDAVNIARRLIKRIAAFDYPSLQGHQVTASIGVSQWDGQDDLSNLVRKADVALYVAKEKGKNRVEKSEQQSV